MLYLKETNLEDMEKEYLYITNLPKDENGFTNGDFGVSREEFENKVLPNMLNHAKGIGLPEGIVPCIEYFLWDDSINEIVGVFRLRTELNDGLRNGAGHIGYGIKKEYRGKGYGLIGLNLIIEKAWDIIKEDEIYMAVNKDNLASLKTQLKASAYIHHEDENHYFTRIKRP